MLAGSMDRERDVLTRPIPAEAFQLAPPAASTLAAVLSTNEGEPAGSTYLDCISKGCRSTLNPVQWPRIRDAVVGLCGIRMDRGSQEPAGRAF